MTADACWLQLESAVVGHAVALSEVLGPSPAMKPD